MSIDVKALSGSPQIDQNSIWYIFFVLTVELVMIQNDPLKELKNISGKFWN